MNNFRESEIKDAVSDGAIKKNTSNLYLYLDNMEHKQIIIKE
jgi:hypothetical protein